jgi:hypothetical protein
MQEVDQLVASAKVLLQRALKLAQLAEARLTSPQDIGKAARHAEFAVQYVGLVAKELKEDRGQMSEAIDLIVAEHMRQISGEHLPRPAPPRTRTRPKKAPPAAKKGLRGDTRTLSLSDLINWLGVQEKTGLLEVQTPEETITLVFRSGTLTAASSDASPKGSRLGEVMIDMAMISAETLEKVLERFTGSSSRLGAALEHEEFVSKTDLKLALETQIQMLFNRLFSAYDAKFVFHENQRPETDGRVSLNLQHLLLESARQHDESSSVNQESAEP